MMRKIIHQAAEILDESRIPLPTPKHFPYFREGAFWMADAMKNVGLAVSQTALSQTNWTYYGCFKYGISLAAALLSFLVFWEIHFILSVLSVLVFYIVEVHFLFLFPLLLQGVKNPMAKSISMTYKLGLFPTALKTIHIGLFMLFGFFSLKNPLKSWYIGCFAVLLWYQKVGKNGSLTKAANPSDEWCLKTLNDMKIPVIFQKILIGWVRNSNFHGICQRT